MNEAALDMRIDGFPILFFQNDADRVKAHGSPEMAACNFDSRLFIGAVSRVITDIEEVVSVAANRTPISLIALSPQGTDSDIPAFPNVRGLVRCHVREQGAAPNNTIPHLAVAIGGAAQIWFNSVVDLEEAVASTPSTKTALFVVEEHKLDVPETAP